MCSSDLEARLTIRFLQPDAAAFYLDLISLSVDSVLLDGQRINFKTENQRIVIPVENSVDTTLVAVFYHGRPANDGFGGFFFGSRTIWTVGEGLYTNPPSMFRYWAPSHDEPSDKATLDMKVTVPQPLQVVSNGLLVSATGNPENKTTTFYWKESHPIATYLIAVSIDKYAVFTDNYISVSGDTIPLQFYVYPKNLERAQEDWKDTAKMIAFFESKFVPFPFDKYGMVEVPMRGAMEHQSMTSYSSGLITGDHRYDYIVAHELAHQWWGDMITCDSFHHIWLNEGFATYCEALWAERVHGHAALHTVMGYNKYMGPGTIYVKDTGKDDIFSGALSYAKASWVLHMLRHVVGDTTFFSILREYYQRYQYKTATTEQFRDVCEDISGKDLHTFFHQWIYESGHPEYEYLWKAEKIAEEQYKVSGMINQTQTDGPVFKMPIDITIKTESADTTIVFTDTTASAPFAFTINSKPTGVVLDKDEWSLCRVQEIDSPRFQVLSMTVNDSLGNNNAEFEQGEQISLIVDLANFGLEIGRASCRERV